MFCYKGEKEYRLKRVSWFVHSMDGVQSAQPLYKHVPKFEIGDQDCWKTKGYAGEVKKNLESPYVRTCWIVGTEEPDLQVRKKNGSRYLGFKQTEISSFFVITNVDDIRDLKHSVIIAGMLSTFEMQRCRAHLVCITSARAQLDCTQWGESSHLSLSARS